MTLSETEEELVGYQASMAQFKVEMGQMESKLNEGDAAQVEARSDHYVRHFFLFFLPHPDLAFSKVNKSKFALSEG